MKINNTMKYKGYIGSVEFSEEDKIFFGRVLGIHTYVSYDGNDVDTLISSFHQMVDDYLLMCKENNIEPEIGYKGSFNIRVSPELHEKIARLAISKNISLNKAIEEAIAAAVKDIA